MKETIDALLARHGTDMVIVSDLEEQAVRGFFRAVNSTSWQSIESVATPLGEVFRGQYVYLGPAGVPAREGDTLQVGDRNYIFRRLEPYRMGKEVLYLWGLCVEKGVNDTWGSQS